MYLNVTRIKCIQSRHNYCLSNINIYMFRLIYSHLQADREDTKEMLTAAWEVWDFGPYINLCMK